MGQNLAIPIVGKSSVTPYSSAESDSERSERGEMITKDKENTNNTSIKRTPRKTDSEALILPRASSSIGNLKLQSAWNQVFRAAMFQTSDKRDRELRRTNDVLAVLAVASIVVGTALLAANWDEEGGSLYEQSAGSSSTSSAALLFCKTLKFVDVALTVGILLVLVTYYRLLAKQRCTEQRFESPWSAFVNSTLKYSFAVEVAVNLPTPLPFMDSGDVFGDSVALFHFLRVYFMARCVRDYASVFRQRLRIIHSNARLRSTRPKFGLSLVVRMLFFERTAITLSAMLALCVLVSAFCLHVVERDKNPDFRRFSECLWVTAVGLTLGGSGGGGSGGASPITAWGRIITAFEGAVGLLFISLLAGVMTNRLTPTDSQLYAIGWLQRNESNERLTKLAAHLIWTYWLRFKGRLSRKRFNALYRHLMEEFRQVRLQKLRFDKEDLSQFEYEPPTAAVKTAASALPLAIAQSGGSPNLGSSSGVTPRVSARERKRSLLAAAVAVASGGGGGSMTPAPLPNQLALAANLTPRGGSPSRWSNLSELSDTDGSCTPVDESFAVAAARRARSRSRKVSFLSGEAPPFIPPPPPAPGGFIAGGGGGPIPPPKAGGVSLLHQAALNSYAHHKQHSPAEAASAAVAAAMSHSPQPRTSFLAAPASPLFLGGSRGAPPPPPPVSQPAPTPPPVIAPLAVGSLPQAVGNRLDSIETSLGKLSESLSLLTKQMQRPPPPPPPPLKKREPQQQQQVKQRKTSDESGVGVGKRAVMAQFLDWDVVHNHSGGSAGPTRGRIRTPWDSSESSSDGEEEEAESDGSSDEKGEEDPSSEHSSSSNEDQQEEPKREKEKAGHRRSGSVQSAGSGGGVDAGFEELHERLDRVEITLGEVEDFQVSMQEAVEAMQDEQRAFFEEQRKEAAVVRSILDRLLRSANNRSIFDSIVS